MKHHFAPRPAPATDTKEAFQDRSYLFDKRRVARLLIIEDKASVCGYGVAVAFRRKDKSFVTREGLRPGWRLEYVIIPRTIAQYYLQGLLIADKPPLWVEEEQLAVDLFRAYVERGWDMVPDLRQKWDEIHLGRGRKAVDLHPPQGWTPSPPRRATARHYDLGSTSSLCRLWLALHGEASLPPRLELELRRYRRMMGE